MEYFTQINSRQLIRTVNWKFDFIVYDSDTANVVRFIIHVNMLKVGETVKSFYFSASLDIDEIRLSISVLIDSFSHISKSIFDFHFQDHNLIVIFDEIRWNFKLIWWHQLIIER